MAAGRSPRQCSSAGGRAEDRDLGRGEMVALAALKDVSLS